MAKKTVNEPSANDVAKEYRVLARKYRPQNFAELKGQDALVRTLTNAIETGRVAHAFMLTGVRGVGKTTTARIIARALNCEKGPTASPCGVCGQCKSITEDRHVDVLEMDAASRTGVDDIREIIDSVQYAPVSGRYKVFIIDEVHMLSKQAFNALLKTLEEPPQHVKFVFATTEIRKVPITVLSRCQRFDLKRVDADILEGYFSEILEKEKRAADKNALALIARAADGSVRDGLSLLDQAIAQSSDKIGEERVRDMLGLVDRSVTLDLFESLMKGDAPGSLALLDGLYKGGADPAVVLQDLLEHTHYLTKVKVSPDIANDRALAEAERVRGLEMAQNLSLPVLTRTWQILQKGVMELHYAPQPQQALEMVLIRLIYAADQPTPGDVLKQLKDGTTVSAGAAPASSAGPVPRGTTIMGGGSAMAQAVPRVVSETAAVADFEQIVALFGQNKEALLQAHLVNYVHLVKFQKGHLAIRLKEGAPHNLAGSISDKLSQWTGERWVVSLSREQGAPTLSEMRKDADAAVMREVQALPLVSEVMKIFPGTTIIGIQDKK